MKAPSTTPVSFAVRRLFSRGCRMDSRVVARAIPVIGELELVTLRYADRRALRVLELLDRRDGIQPRLLPSLHDPCLCTLGALGFLVRGVEVIEEGQHTREYVQEWHVQFILRAAAADDGGRPG